jgi:hypothetical protein
MKDCPECQAPVDGIVCRQCGFAERPESEPRKELTIEYVPIIRSCVGSDLQWARRIVERERSGEVVPHIAIEMAREALGLPEGREPGEEG